MNILFASGIYPPDAGGPATYVQAMARVLVAKGHQVAVVAYGEKEGVIQEEGFEVELIGRNQRLPLRYAKFAMAVRRQACARDIVYLQGPGSEGIPGTVGALLARKPIVMKVVGDYAWEIASGQGEKELLDTFLTHRHKGKIRLLEALERWSSARAKALITPSAYLKMVVEKWGVPAERITVIPNVVSALPQGQSRDAARTSFGVDGQRVMLTAVRAVPWKGGDFLIALLPKLPKDVILVIAGDGPELTRWKSIADAAGVADRVRFLGRLSRTELADWFRAADVFMLASGYEGYPWVVAEAASIGLPSFVSDKGGNPEAQELLGASLVTILPYQDQAAWLQALTQSWPPRVPNITPPSLTPEKMVEQTLHILSTAV